MKKTYMNPNMVIVKMQMHQHLLDGSEVLEKGGAGKNTEWGAREMDFFDEE